MKIEEIHTQQQRFVDDLQLLHQALEEALQRLDLIPDIERGRRFYMDLRDAATKANARAWSLEARAAGLLNLLSVKQGAEADEMVIALEGGRARLIEIIQTTDGAREQAVRLVDEHPLPASPEDATQEVFDRFRTLYRRDIAEIYGGRDALLAVPEEAQDHRYHEASWRFWFRAREWGRVRLQHTKSLLERFEEQDGDPVIIEGLRGLASDIRRNDGRTTTMVQSHHTVMRGLRAQTTKPTRSLGRNSRGRKNRKRRK